MAFLPMKTVYQRKADGAKSTSFVDLLPPRLTLDRSFKATRFFNHRRTMFDEIEVARMGDVLNQSSRGVFEAKTGIRRETRRELLERIKRRLREVVLEHWRPTAAHAVLHSSGLDSRCLSWTIKQLHKELGDGWLGQVVFCCTKWERTSFRRIMVYEGWEPHQYMVANNVPYLLDSAYYAHDLCNFKNAWKWSDGASAIPVNLFWYPVREAVEREMLPPDFIQTWTGQWGNTVLDAGSGGGGQAIKKAVKMFYYSALCQRPMYGDYVVHPYADTWLARLACESSIRLGKRLRPLLAKYLDPHLASFVNEAADGDRHRRIADWVIAQMRNDYARSWYGRKVRPNAKPHHKTTEFQAYWYHWTAASLCDELLRQGHEIRVRR